MLLSPVVRTWLALGLLAPALWSVYASVRGNGAPYPPPPAASTAGRPIKNERYAWKPVQIGAGGFLTGMSSDDAGKTRVTQTDVHGAWLWDEDKDRWRQLLTAASVPAADRVQNGMNEGVFAIAVAPSESKRIYVAIKGAVYQSQDRGDSWQRAAPGDPFPAAFDANSEFRHYGPFLIVAADNPDHVLFGTPLAGVWHSLDGGITWRKSQGIPPARDLRPDEPGVQAPGIPMWLERGENGSRTGRIWAASPGHGIYVSDDGGATFTPQMSDAPPGTSPLILRRGVFARDGSFYGVDSENKHVWRYRQGRWDELSRAANLPALRYAAIAADPRSDALLLFDEGGRAFRSMDGGRNWWRLWRSSTVGAGDPPWLRVADKSYFATSDVQFDPVRPGRIWTAAGTGIYYAEGQPAGFALKWISQSRGIEELVANDVVQPPGRAPLFAAWDFGVHLRPDLDRFSTGYGPRERVIIAVQQVDWSAADPSFLVTNASDTRRFCCSEDGQSILAGYSTDGGRSWQRFATLPHPPGTKAEDPWRMSYGMIAVSANDSGNIIWAPSFNRSPFFTRDRGRTWQRVSLPGERLPFTGSHAVYFRQRKTLAADRVLPGRFYLVHSGDGANAALAGLWRTDNGGAKWTRVFKGEIAPVSDKAAKLRVVPGMAGHLFFTSGIAGGPDTRLRRSVDGGRRWTILDRATQVDDIAFGKAAAGSRYPAIFISGRIDGRYGIWRSIDSAQSWQRLAAFPAGKLDQVTVMDADKNVFGRVYIGYMGSGWLYGEPAPCTPQPLRPGDAAECRSVD